MASKKNRKKNRPRPIPDIEIIETLQPAPADLDLSKPWYLVFTAPRGEERVARDLAEAGCQVFWPHFIRTTKRKNKPEVANKVSTFRRYLFASGAPLRQRVRDRVMPDRSVITAACRPLDDIRQIDGVLFVVSGDKGYCAVPRRALEEVIHYQGPIARPVPATRPAPVFQPAAGDRVRVIDGPFSGFQATVVEALGLEAAKVLIDIFGRQTAAEFDLAQIEAA